MLLLLLILLLSPLPLPSPPNSLPVFRELRLPSIEGAPGVQSGVDKVAGDAKHVADDVLAPVLLARGVDIPWLFLPVSLGLWDVAKQFCCRICN